MGEIVIESRGLSKRDCFFVAFDAFNLCQVGLHGINITMLERGKVLRNLSQKHVVLLVFLFDFGLDLCEHVVEINIINLSKVEIFTL